MLHLTGNGLDSLPADLAGSVTISLASELTIILTSYGLDSLPADLAGSVTISLASNSTVILTSYALSHWQWT